LSWGGTSRAATQGSRVEKVKINILKGGKIDFMSLVIVIFVKFVISLRDGRFDF
jgi:hypothetical protein